MMEAEVDAELQSVTAAACVLTVEGQAQPNAKAVWLRAPVPCQSSTVDKQQVRGCSLLFC